MSYLSDTDRTSFKGLFSFTDYLKEEIVKARTTEADYWKEQVLREVMVEYYEKIRLSTRLKSQAGYCKAALLELYPAFCRGYFGKTKSI